MKKILFLTMAVLATASCSENEIITEAPAPEPGTGLITFASQFGNTVATRADAALPQTVSLGVFAFSGTVPSIYDGIEDMRLRYVALKNGWFLNPEEHYYPADGSGVDFWAYGPKGNTHLSSIDCDPVDGPKFTLNLVSTDIGPTAVDIFATQAKATGDLASVGTPVTFTLKHLLSKVKFTAKTKTKQEADNYDVKIVDISIKTKGKADYANKGWGNYATSADIEWKPVDEDDTQAVLTETATGIGEEVSLIPGQLTTIVVQASVYKKNQSVKVGDQKTTLTLDNSGVGKEFLEAGKCYTYTIEVSPKVGKITFDVPQISDWTNVNGTINIPEPAPAP